MNAQLVLLTDEQIEWRLDEQTREVGRQGLARARAALASTGAASSDRDQAAA